MICSYFINSKECEIIAPDGFGNNAKSTMTNKTHGRGNPQCIMNFYVLFEICISYFFLERPREESKGLIA